MLAKSLHCNKNVTIQYFMVVATNFISICRQFCRPQLSRAHMDISNILLTQETSTVQQMPHYCSGSELNTMESCLKDHSPVTLSAAALASLRKPASLARFPAAQMSPSSPHLSAWTNGTLMYSSSYRAAAWLLTQSSP